MQSRTRQAATRITYDIAPVAFFSTEGNPWSQLQLYNIYRLVLAGALLLVALTEHLLPEGTIIDSKLFNDVIAIFTVVIILQNIAGYMKWPDYNKQIYLTSITDILALLLVIYASGGVSFGLGILLVLPVITPNLFKPGQFSLFITALTVISLISIEIHIQSQGHAQLNELSMTGVLSLFMMLSSWIAMNWAGKAQNTAKLAKRWGLDLASMSQLNQAVLDQLQTGVIVIRDSRHIQQMNTAAIEMLGNPKNWRDQSLDSFAPELDAWYQHWSEKQRPKIASFDVNHQGAMAMRVRFVQLGARASETSLIYLQDTQEEREKLQDLKLASLGQLTASIAHEIRNPLGAISHAAQLLTESEVLSKADERLTQIIISNSLRTDSIINTVLNLSKRKNPKRVSIRLKSWLDDFFEDFLAQNRLDENQLSIFIEPEDAEVNFDPAHLHQIMWNLCKNAVKYAKEDKDKLTLLIQVGVPDHTKNLVLNVIDNGEGISEEFQERLFEPFNTTSTKGTGLGLFMCRELSQANGSTLEYVQLASSGSCFRLSFANR
ncbi:MAG: PAS domain-containing sensor histidine kinase [Thiotrichaceae bacterium]